MALKPSSQWTAEGGLYIIKWTQAYEHLAAEKRDTHVQRLIPPAH